MKNHKEIKVLYVAHYRELYGANRSLLQMILELREKGIRPTVLLPEGESQPDNNLSSELQKHNIPFVEAPIRFDKHGNWKKVLANYALSLIIRKRALDAVKGLDIDLVHSNSSVVSIGAYIAKKLKKPHVWHCREFGGLDYGYKTPFGKWYQKVIFRGNNTFIAISEKIKSHYRKYIGGQEMRVIYNGITPSRQKGGLDNEKVEFCIVGLIQPQKGHQELLEAAKLLIEKRGIKNFHINIIGGGYAPCVEALAQEIEKLRLSGYVSMLGRRNDVSELLTKMDVGIMASSHEAFGRATVEYMMAGLPVIASDGGANTEIVEDGESGLIYMSGNSDSLAEKMEILIKDRALRNAYGEKGREIAINKFSSRANSDAVYQLYSEILESV